jgi:hypothetical protein
LCGGQLSSGDLWIGGAAAQVAAHPLPDLGLIARGPSLMSRPPTTPATGAEAALKRVMLDEGLLNGVLCEPLDRDQLVAVK